MRHPRPGRDENARRREFVRNIFTHFIYVQTVDSTVRLKVQVDFSQIKRRVVGCGKLGKFSSNWTEMHMNRKLMERSIKCLLGATPLVAAFGRKFTAKIGADDAAGRHFCEF